MRRKFFSTGYFVFIAVSNISLTLFYFVRKSNGAVHGIKRLLYGFECAFMDASQSPIHISVQSDAAVDMEVNTRHYTELKVAHVRRKVIVAARSQIIA